jgi:uncharacterized protein (DUF2336 family)
MLTHAHYRALRDNPSVTVRADIAVAVAAELAAAALTPAETRIAEQILEALAQDVERRVRQALAEHVKSTPFLPRAIAATLARDIEDAVALPVLECSPVLDDADLVACVRGGGVSRHLAVARRPRLAPSVAEALLEGGSREVVGAVLANGGAEIAESSLHRLVVRYRGDSLVETLVIDRAALPLSVCEALIVSVSEALRRRLVERHKMPPALAEELAALGRERALGELLPSFGLAAAERLAKRLQARGVLTPSLVLRALCLGDLGFFEAAMAALARLPRLNAKALLYDRGVGGLRAIFGKAGLPPLLFRAFRAAVGAVLQGALERGRAGFTQAILDQIVILYDDLSPGDLDHVLSQLARRSQAAPPEEGH